MSVDVSQYPVAPAASAPATPTVAELQAQIAALEAAAPPVEPAKPDLVTRLKELVSDVDHAIPFSSVLKVLADEGLSNSPAVDVLEQVVKAVVKAGLL